jgi:hypothetical protein
MQHLNLVRDLKVRVVTYKRKDSLRNNFTLIITSLATLLSYVCNLRKEIRDISVTVATATFTMATGSKAASSH